jgi:hypothetical protein
MVPVIATKLAGVGVIVGVVVRVPVTGALLAPAAGVVLPGGVTVSVPNVSWPVSATV